MASHADALVALRAQVPERVFRFAEAVASGLVRGEGDPLERAAVAVGAPGEGPRLMADPRAARVLHAILGADSEDFRDTRIAAIRMLVQLVGYDPAGAFDVDGSLIRNIHKIPPEVRVAIEGIDERPDGTLKIRFAKRLDALKLLLTYFGDLENHGRAVGGTATVVFHGRGALE